MKPWGWIFQGKHLGAALALAGLFCLGACGYDFASNPAGGSPDILYIPMLENRTPETGADLLVTNDLIRFLNRSGGFHTVSGVTPSAAYTLRGKVASVYDVSSARRSLGGSTQRRLHMVLSLKLVSGDGETAWNQEALSDFEDYDVVEGSPEATRASRNSAMEALSARLARKVRERLTVWKAGW